MNALREPLYERNDGASALVARQPAPDAALVRTRSFLTSLIRAGGPSPEQFSALTACFDEFHAYCEITGMAPAGRKSFFVGLGGPFAPDASLIGRVFAAPTPGRFAIMEEIYARASSRDPAIRQWDEWFQQTDAAEAVRKRKDFLVGYLNDLSLTVPQGSKVAVLGAGSCREVFEHLAASRGPRLHFDCVDVDKEAVAYAKRIGKDHAHHVSFHCLNALRFRSYARYALIASAGLFDYFSDRVFVTALRQLGKLVSPGGELLIGNFSTTNATHGPMGCAGWTLYERTPADLLRLARTAGYSPRQAWVASEESGVNLFLGIRTPRW